MTVDSAGAAAFVIFSSPGIIDCYRFKKLTTTILLLKGIALDVRRSKGQKDFFPAELQSVMWCKFI